MGTTINFLVLLMTTLANAGSDMHSRQSQEEYLRRFAHLGDSNHDPRMAAIRDNPDEQFRMAIMNFQALAGLNMTGEVDDATVRMMEMPRCGVPDMQMAESVARRKKRYTIATSNRWRNSHLTYRFLNYTPDLPRSLVRQIVAQAFQMWSSVTTLSFSETTGVPDIEVLFGAYDHGDDGPFDGVGGALAHAYFPGPGIGGDAHFDESETWTHRQNSGTNFFQVAVHEIGHSLGLGHSDVQSAIMAPFYRGYNASFRLDQDDIDGIQYLYGARTITTYKPPTQSTSSPQHSGRSSMPTTSSRVYYTTTTPTPTSSSCPLALFICRNFDAIECINGVTHVFKGRYYGLLSRSGRIYALNYIHRKWPSLPDNLDAVMSSHRFVYFFKGSVYWRQDKVLGSFGYRNLRSNQIRYGFPGTPNDLDAAFRWSGNGRIYFIKGNQYYRYRSGYGVDPGYPLSLSVWGNVQGPVSDAFQHPDMVTYFFNGERYQVFNDSTLQASEPRLIRDWMQCCNHGNSYELQEEFNNMTSVENTNMTEISNTTETFKATETPEQTTNGSAALCSSINLLVLFFTSVLIVRWGR